MELGLVVNYNFLWVELHGWVQFRRRELHWLAADDWVRFRVCMQACKCLHNMAPDDNLSTRCQPVSSVPGRRHLRSARRGELDFHVLIWLSTGDGRLPTPVPHLGTLYLTVPRILILLCKPSNAISRPSYFPHTSTFSAFEVSYKNALHKATVVISSRAG